MSRDGPIAQGGEPKKMAPRGSNLPWEPLNRQNEESGRPYGGKKRGPAKGNLRCRKSGISGPGHAFGEPFKVARVSSDQFIRLRLFGNEGVPIVVNSSPLNADGLGLFQGGQNFRLIQFHKLHFWGTAFPPNSILQLAENHPSQISVSIREHHASSSHRGKELRQKMQPGHVFSTIQPIQNFQRESGIDRGRSIPIRFQARLARSSATTLPMASGSSRNPSGILNINRPPSLVSFANTRSRAGSGATGTNLIVPSAPGSHENTWPGSVSGRVTRGRSSTVNVFIRENSQSQALSSSSCHAGIRRSRGRQRDRRQTRESKMPGR